MLTRRRLLSSAAGVAAGLTVAGCGTGAGSNRLRVAFESGGSRETLDPLSATNFVDQARAKALFDTLVTYADDMSVRPRLAESWESDDSGRRWRIRLRRARFHDNRPIDPADVLYSMRRVADPKLASASRQYFAGVDFPSCRRISPTELELVLHNPDFEFPAAWGAPSTEIVPEGTKDFTAPIGSGPFRFVSFTPGGQAVFRRWRGHWAGESGIEELEFVPVQDESARANALLSGQVDYAHDVTATTAARLTGDTRVLTARGTTMQAVNLRLSRPPFDDPRLVQAVYYGVDREELVRIALAGHGSVGNDLFDKGQRGYAAAIPQRHRDVDRARALVREAGAEGLSFPLETSSTIPAFESAATLIARQLGEIGLRVRPNTRAASTYFAQIKTEGVAAQTRTATLPITSFLSQRFRTGASMNVTGFTDPRYDALLDRAAATRAEPDRLGLLADAQQILHDRGGLLVWGFGNWYIGVSQRVHGVRAAPPNSHAWARFDSARIS